MDGEVILTERIIGCALTVHRELGPGLLESTYESALAMELAYVGIPFERQPLIPLFYRGAPIGEHRPDLIVAGRVVVEIKSVKALEPVFTAQTLTYLRVASLHVGLILNFNSQRLRDGIRRVVRRA